MSSGFSSGASKTQDTGSGKTLKQKNSQQYQIRIFDLSCITVYCMVMIMKKNNHIRLSFFRRLYFRFAPQGVLDPDDMNHWKETILYRFIFFSVFFVFIVGAANFPSVIKHDYWVIAGMISIAYLGCLLMLFFPAIGYKKRATATSLLIYTVGISIIYSVGPFVASREWLLSFSVIASILLGWPGAIGSIIINTTTLVGIGILLKTGYWKGALFTDEPLFFWFQISSDLFFINIFTTLFVTFLFKKIEKSDREAKATSTLLLNEQKKLIEAKRKLENEFLEHKQTENELRESEKRFRMLFDEAPDAIFIAALDDRIIDTNTAASKMLGYTRKKFQTMTIADLQAPQVRGEVGSVIRNELTREQFFETLDIHKNGHIVPVEVHNHRMRIGGQDIVLSVSRDITSRKRAEEKETKVQKIIGEHEKMAFVGQIAGKMAHDFNNVLGVIMGNTELALLDCMDIEMRKTLELIFEQTIRGKNLTKNLVAFAKDQEPKQEFFRISEKIDLVVNLLRKDLENIELIKENEPEVQELLADPGMIEHALVNLIQNSIHATSMNETPRIMTRTYSLDNTICFEIEDNGCGIPKEYLKAIFEPSFTLKGTRDVTGSYEDSIKGTGYGMANVKKYIEQHKGNISLESKLGLGTKFTISLPVIKRELTIKEKKEILEEIDHFEKYILLVEDEQAISDVQYRILTQEPCNHKVDTANNGQVAMDLFDRNEYDFVSLDYALPGKINGMDVYHHIRKKDKIIPILFISGNIEFLESIKELKQKDIKIDHLSKPCQNKDYINCINRLF
jgi:PAS domain S-box-containing protein